MILSVINRKRNLLVLGVVGLLLASVYLWWGERAIIIFDDVTVQSGIAKRGVTYGAAWTDVDNDGRPDVYLTNHLNKASLYKNIGEGRFEEVTGEYFLDSQVDGDKHGAAWGDFNNDGRQELIQLTGAMRGVGSEAKRLFIWNGERYVDMAEALGVANIYSRARMPLWFDLNNDGRLDLIQGAAPRLDGINTAPFAFVQQNEKFVEGFQQFNHLTNNMPFCIITELNGDYRAELLCRVSGKQRAAIIYDSATGDLSRSHSMPSSAFEDVAAGDFDNDGNIDLFLTRRNPAAKVAYGQSKNNELMVDFYFDKNNFNKIEEIKFETSGDLSVAVTPVMPIDGLSAKNIYIGDVGVSPVGTEFRLTRETSAATWSLSPKINKGLAIHIGRIGENSWSIRASSPQDNTINKPVGYREFAIKIVSSKSINNVAVESEASKEEAPARLLMNRHGKLIDESKASGLEQVPLSGVNVVTGDFNNDMYLDIFIVGSNAIGKTSNMLLLNRGNGRFQKVKKAGGAGGSSDGVGDSATVVDFNGDGLLDLLVSTGGSMGRSEGPISAEGGYHLYRNIGKGNNWIQIDLIGKKSNRDGVGARVEVIANGVKQTRIQDAGIHNLGQNYSRLHFGMKSNAFAEIVMVHWPSGVKQVLHNVPVNKVHKIEETIDHLSNTE